MGLCGELQGISASAIPHLDGFGLLEVDEDTDPEGGN